MVVHVTRSATLRARKMLFARGNRIFLRANGFDFFFSCLKVCKLTRATVCIYICNLVFVHFEHHKRRPWRPQRPLSATSFEMWPLDEESMAPICFLIFVFLASHDEVVWNFSHQEKGILLLTPFYSFLCFFFPFLAFESCKRQLKSQQHPPFTSLLLLPTPFKR